jgi:hypothetical protein
MASTAVRPLVVLSNRLGERRIAHGLGSGVPTTPRRLFGQDGTGGLAGFWLVRANAELLEQPVVFFGSEGARCVVAGNFGDFVWLVAAGIGPLEASEYGDDIERAPQPELTAYARAIGGVPVPAAEVLATARAEFPDFDERIQALCR